MIVSFFGSNSAFKIQFQEYLEEKTPKYVPVELFILVFLTKYLRSALFHETSPSFIMHLEKLFRPTHCENFTTSFFLLPNKHQPPWKNYVLRTSPEDAQHVLRMSPLGPICNTKGSICSSFPLERTQDVILTIIHKMGF